MSLMAMLIAFRFISPYAVRSPVRASRAPIVMVPDRPDPTVVVAVILVLEGGAIMDGAAAYITTRPINKPTTKVPIAIFEDFLPSDIEISKTYLAPRRHI